LQFETTRGNGGIGGGGLRHLGVPEVFTAYAEIFGCSERQAADQLRSREALEGALARPLWYAQYAGADLAYQAAVLTHGIAETQPFIDGNKRTALGTMLIFLDWNGYGLSASQSERLSWMIRLSEGASVEELAERIRSCLVPVQP
jgi:death on curing protein